MLGPFFSQVLGNESIFFRQWAMFTGAAKDIIDLNFYLMENDAESKIDIFRTLGYDSRQNAPRSLKRITSKKQVMRVAKRICRKFKLKKDIRMYARQGSRSYWMPFAEGENNVCENIKKKNDLWDIAK
jgi:hypothetical protein